MAHAYTPGLKVTERTLLKKVRRLPLLGKVLVQKGQKVKAEDVVARTELPGKAQLLGVVNHLGVMPAEINEVMLKKPGEAVKKDEMIAQNKGLFGFFKSSFKAPADGAIESISDVTGQMLFRETPIPVEVKAYIDGQVVETKPDEYAVVETTATFIQGIFGVGGEISGELKIVSSDPDAELSPKDITPDCRDKILVGGSLVTHDVVKKAVELKVRGIITGGINDWDIKQILGYDIGVAITGSEDIGITLVITEGFGKMRMAERTFELLKAAAGKKASMSGATQIRAGVMRPEIIITTAEVSTSQGQDEETVGVLRVGTPIRVIREPYFGQLGKVSNLPSELQVLPTESKVRVLEVAFGSGEKVILPRANVEIIEE